MVAQVSETQPDTMTPASEVTALKPVIKLPLDKRDYVECLVKCEHGAEYSSNCFSCIEAAILNNEESVGTDQKAKAFLESLPREVVVQVDDTARKIRAQFE